MYACAMSSCCLLVFAGTRQKTSIRNTETSARPMRTLDIRRTTLLSTSKTKGTRKFAFRIDTQEFSDNKSKGKSLFYKPAQNID